MINRMIAAGILTKVRRGVVRLGNPDAPMRTYRTGGWGDRRYEAKVNGMAVLDMERTVVRILEGQGPMTTEQIGAAIGSQFYDMNRSYFAAIR